MEKSRSKTYLYKTKDIMIDIFEKLKNSKNNLDTLTDDELGKLFSFGTAIQVMAQEEYEERHTNVSGGPYECPDDLLDIYDLSLRNVDQILG